MKTQLRITKIYCCKCSVCESSNTLMESLVTIAKESQSEKGKQEKMKQMTDDILRGIKERQQITLRNGKEGIKSSRTLEISASKQITNGLICKNRIIAEHIVEVMHKKIKELTKQYTYPMSLKV